MFLDVASEVSQFFFLQGWEGEWFMQLQAVGY